MQNPAIHFGAAYYLEYEPTPRLEHDLDMMVEAGFTVIRVGESVWSTWEPEDGVFDLDWLEPVLDAAHERGIGVLLGTPTYAVPLWLARKHPEIAADTATGESRRWGARQEMDFTHAAFLFHAERITRAVVGRYKDHPAIIGYQVDNEPGLQLVFNENVFQRFVDTLRREYGTVERINEQWGLVYWSHRLSTWADLWRPDGNSLPQYDLAWRRFQADLVTEYISWQADIVRSIVGPDAVVTTCISYEQPGIEDVDLTENLSIASGNAYYEMEEALAHPSEATRSSGVMGWVVRGPWAVRELADLMWSSRQKPFWVTETNAGAIGFAPMNESPYDGQWRQIAWLLVARGARMVEYWQWNTLHFGGEAYWGGVIPHSGIPGRAYAEIATIGAELSKAGDAFSDAVPEYDVTLLWDSDSKFAMSSQSPFAAETEWSDPESYRVIMNAFSRGVFDAKRQLRIVRPQQFLPTRGGDLTAAEAATRYPVLLAPALYAIGDEDLDFLVEYANAGGHLISGPRTGYADSEARPRFGRQPGRLADAAGVWFDETASLHEPVGLDGLDGSATKIGELLVADGAEVVATYDHPHYGKWAAATTNGVGSGRITALGFVPDQASAEDIARRIAPEPLVAWNLPASVTAASSRAADGSRVIVLHNWSWETQEFAAPDALEDLVSRARIESGETIAFHPWDVRILRTA